MSIYFGRCKRAMAEQLLDVADIDVVFQQQRSERVAEHVWGDVRRKPRFTSVSSEHLPYGAVRDPAPPSG